MSVNLLDSLRLSYDAAGSARAAAQLATENLAGAREILGMPKGHRL